MTSARRCPGALWRLVRGRARREDGQALLLVVGGLIALLAMAGFVIDVGRIYVAQQNLQSAVDAASLAAAQDMPNPSNAQTTANIYSMAPNGTPGCSGTVTGSCLNVNPNIATATVPVVKTLCVKTFPGSATPTNIPCQTYQPGTANASGYSCSGVTSPYPTLPGGVGGSPDATGCNAVQVTESAKVNTTFLNVIGVGSLFSAITSKSTVLMRGGTPHPLDVMIVLDVSGSMNNACTNSGNTAYQVAGGNGTSSKLDCAKEGIRSLISNLWPCDPSLVTCPSPNTDPLDKVGLEIFPGLNNASFAPEFDCGWTLGFGDEGYSNSSGYDVVPLSSDFKASDNGGLVGTSQLVEATSWSSCNQGTWPPGNDPASSGGTPGNQSKYGAEAPNCPSSCTFFADALGNAQFAIYNDQQDDLVNNPSRHAKGVIILLSDGDANIGEANACQDAVNVANSAAFAPFNDWVFSIGYDTPATGCSTDTGGVRSEVEQVNVSATAGQFTMTYGGNTSTTNVPWNGTAAQMLAALNTIPALTGNVTVTGGGGGGTTHTWNVTFTGTLASKALHPSPALSGASATPPLSGGNATIAVVTTTFGNAGGSGRNPFTTMRDIASDPTRFYCLHPPTIGGVVQTCNGANAATLNQIFKDVGIAISGTRLISNP